MVFQKISTRYSGLLLFKRSLSIFHFIVPLLFVFSVSCIKGPGAPPPRQDPQFVIAEINRIEREKKSQAEKQKLELERKRIRNTLDINLDPYERDFCANLRINASYETHKQGKKYLKSYYTNREMKYLFYAWYSSEDSKYLTDLVPKCSYKNNGHFNAVKYLSRLNKSLQKTITVNMRDDEYKRIGELYLEDYQSIFPRDLR